MQVGGSGVMNTGLAGIQKGQDQLTQAANKVANANTNRPVNSTQELAEPLMEQDEAQRQVEASAKVVEAGSQMIGSLVDIKV